MLSVFITPWMKPDVHPLRDQRGLARGHARRAARGSGRGAAASVRVVPRDRVVGQPAHALQCRRAPRSTGRCRRGCGWPPRASARRRAARCSRSTGSPVAATASARVVGMPSACIASPISTRAASGPTAAWPSPPRENGVRPEPLKCMSRRRPCRSTTSPSSSARPSPSCGEKPPNWWPAYACAIGSAPSGNAVAGEDRRALRRRPARRRRARARRPATR